MSDTIIKHCKMNWGMEEHKFTFVTGGSAIEALDSLGDLIGSLEYLYEGLAEGGLDKNRRPREIKVVGGCGWTQLSK